MQCSMGFDEQPNGRWKFNITFFFPDTTGGTFDADRPLIDRFNHFVSKSDFGDDIESSLFGSLLSDALRHAMVEHRDINYALTMLNAAAEKVPCPEELTKEIEEHYAEHGTADPVNPDDPIGLDGDDDEEEMLN